MDIVDYICIHFKPIFVCFVVA